MGATYTRQSSFTDGDVITADLFNNEYDQLLAAFASSTGHTHDGTAGEGGPLANMLGHSITFGSGTAGSDVVITFDGETNDGVFKWMEDEDYFEFSDDVLIATTEKLQFRDTAIYINSSVDGQLDLVADTEIQIAATTIDINGLVDISGNLSVGGNLDVTGTIDFSDSNITNAGTMGLDSIFGDDDANTSITFSGSDVITIANAGTNQVTFNDGSIAPVTDSDVDLGTNSLRFKDAYIDSATVTGNVLAGGTVEPAGDTAAGDNAAIGYTSVEGLILTGQGSTNDVTIKNDADADVIEIPTGTVNVTMAGTLDVVGDVTGGNFQPDGDTAAGDAAAIGYTSAEGLILTGQGSTNDITIKNDADADVITIATGTTVVGIPGSLDIEGAIDVNGTANLDVVDIDGAVDMATTLQVDGVATFTGRDIHSGGITIANAGQIGSVGDTDAIAIASDGVVTLTQKLIGTELDISGDIDVDGTANLDIVDIDGAVDMATTLAVAGNVDFNGDLDVDGTTNLDIVDIDGAVNMATTALVTGVLTTTAATVHNGGITMPDNAKALFGTGSDLEIYHDGSDSFVSDTGTGDLYLQGSSNIFFRKGDGSKVFAHFADDGACKLRFNNSTKIETTNTGVTVTGEMAATTMDLSSNAVIDGTALVTGVLTTTAAAVFNGGFTSNADTNTFTSANSTDPRVVIKNTTNDTNAAVLNFVKDKGAAGADEDSIGSIFFTGDNDAQEQTLFARINGLVETAADGQEGGRIQLQVANHDAGMATGLSVFDGSENNEIDVNIALGTSSLTSVAGNLDVTGNAVIDGTALVTGVLTTTAATVHTNGITFPEGNVINTITTPNTGMNFIVNSGSSNVTRNFIFSSSASGGSVTEKMRIDSSGRVLIGTTTEGQSQADNLTVSDSGNMGMTLRSTDSSECSIFFSDGTSGAGEYAGSVQYVHSSDALFFGTAGVTNVRINSAGHMYLHTGGLNEPSSSQTGVRVTGVDGQNFWISSNSGTSGYNQFAFHNANGVIGNITTSGSGTSFGTSSDYRLKENVVYDWDATTRLKQLKPARFNFIADADTTVDGFLAHEAQAVVPDCATGTKDAMKDEEYEVTPAVLDENGTETTAAVMGTRSVPDIQSIDHSKIVPLLVKTIQELEARITALEG